MLHDDSHHFRYLFHQSQKLQTILKITLFASETDMIRVKSVKKIQKISHLHDVHSQEQGKKLNFLSTSWNFAFLSIIYFWNQDRL